MNRWQKGTMLALLAAIAMALPAQAAQADDDGFTGETVTADSTAETRETCRDPELAPLLQDFNDDDLYFVAPGGDFESGEAGWQLAGGATIGIGSSAFSPFG